MNAVRWGLLSTASIGGLVVRAARRSQAARFVAVASRDGNRARQFAADLSLERAFASYEALLESDVVDAVYVALPNSMHVEWTIKALRAGVTPSDSWRYPDLLGVAQDHGDGSQCDCDR